MAFRHDDSLVAGRTVQEKGRPRSCPDSVSYTQDEEFIVSWHETQALHLTIYGRLVYLRRMGHGRQS